MARVNTDILEISELKWMRMVNLFQMTIISTAVGKNLLEKNGVYLITNKKSPKYNTCMQSQKRKNEHSSFPRQTHST